MREFLAAQDALVNRTPLLGYFGENLIMRAAHGVSIRGYAIVFKKAAADGQIAHVPVEHSDRGWGMFHKQGKQGLTLGKLCFCAPPRCVRPIERFPKVRDLGRFRREPGVSHNRQPFL
jgi:hypothetical protein